MLSRGALPGRTATTLTILATCDYATLLFCTPATGSSPGWIPLVNTTGFSLIICFIYVFIYFIFLRVPVLYILLLAPRTLSTMLVYYLQAKKNFQADFFVSFQTCVVNSKGRGFTQRLWRTFCLPVCAILTAKSAQSFAIHSLGFLGL